MSARLPDGPERMARIDALVREFLCGGASSPEQEEARLIASHPELLPELAERLRTARGIFAASAAARENGRSRGAAEHDAELAFLREALPAYEILGVEHQGGQGVVYRAVQRVTGRVVALKLPLGGPLLSALESERFEREVRLVADLDHPHIVTLYDAGVAHGRRYYSMEFIEGLPINDYVLCENLSVPQIVRLFIPVARAVHHAHTRGIIHRDLKPANILVSHAATQPRSHAGEQNGSSSSSSMPTPKILDFGLAKLVGPALDDSAISMPGNIIGTLPYTSPEQASGDGDVQTPSDVYALGVVLYELLTETHPYPIHGSPGEVRRHIRGTPPKSARKMLAEQPVPSDPHRKISRELDAILLKALRKEPESRYNSAADLAEDLERFLAGELVHALADEAYYVMATLVRRHRRAALAAAGMAGVLIVALVVVSLAWQATERARRVAQAGLEMAARVHLGGVERDGRRIESALTLLESAVKIGEQISSDDPIVQQYLHAALLSLADVYRLEQRDEEAAKCVALLAERAERAHRADPSDLELVRRLALARSAQAASHEARQDWKAALEPAQEALRLFRDLVVQSPTLPSTRRSVASALTRVGGILQNDWRLGEAYPHFTEARAIYDGLLTELGPTTARRIAILRIDANIASWRLARTTDEDDRIAREVLLAAIATLRELESRPDAGMHQLQLLELRRSLFVNRSLLEKPSRH